MFVVVIGNLARAFGPFPSRLAAKVFADQFDPGSETYNPGPYRNYSREIVELTDPKLHAPAFKPRADRS
jgi:hypothetical protein